MRMSWMGFFGNNKRRMLHLEIDGRWVPYNNTRYFVPDHNVPGGSAGWATYQALNKQGWELIPDPTQTQEAPES